MRTSLGAHATLLVLSWGGSDVELCICASGACHNCIWKRMRETLGNRVFVFKNVSLKGIRFTANVHVKNFNEIHVLHVVFTFLYWVPLPTQLYVFLAFFKNATNWEYITIYLSPTWQVIFWHNNKKKQKQTNKKTISICVYVSTGDRVQKCFSRAARAKGKKLS